MLERQLDPATCNRCLGSGLAQERGRTHFGVPTLVFFRCSCPAGKVVAQMPAMSELRAMVRR